MATRENQQVFGTASNTYTMAGITTQASKNAQSGQTYLVTSDSAGNLATTSFSPDQAQYDISSLQGDINSLQRRDEQLASGVAISLALAQPLFQPGQEFAVRVGWGDFDGSSAFGVTAAGVVAAGFVGPTSTVIVDGGIGTGTSTNMVAGRTGVSLGW